MYVIVKARLIMEKLEEFLDFTSEEILIMSGNSSSKEKQKCSNIL